MDLGLDDHLKCRICLSPDATADFIQLKGSKADMFEEVIGVKLTTDGVELESVMCQNCFGKLENSHDFRAQGIRAHREFFEIQRTLAITQQRSNETAQATDEVEPEAEASAEAIQRMVDEPEQPAYEVEPPEAATIELYSPSRVKHEPPVEFVLILPRATSDQSQEDEIDDDIKRKWVESVQLEKFDTKWQIKSKRFQTFLSCQHCQLVMKSQGQFNRHLRACSKMKSARLECDICGKGVQKKSQMGRHMFKHCSERKFRCSECGKRYKRKDDLTRHVKIHDTPIACFDCQKKFSTHQHLKTHQMQQRHGIYATMPEETFDCERCDKTFSSPRYLKQHQKQVHDENEVKCKICDKILKNRASLLDHSRQTHSKIECSICHRKIAKYLMASHERSHSSHFECDLCNQFTNDKSNLKVHIERMHLLKKLVKDSKCRPDFSDFELLEKLQLKHGIVTTSAEKTFRCDKCKKSFATPSSLVSHKRKVHPEKLFDCHVCKKSFKTKHDLKKHTNKVHAKMSVEVK